MMEPQPTQGRDRKRSVYLRHQGMDEKGAVTVPESHSEVCGLAPRSVASDAILRGGAGLYGEAYHEIPLFPFPIVHRPRSCMRVQTVQLGPRAGSTGTSPVSSKHDCESGIGWLTGRPRP